MFVASMNETNKKRMKGNAGVMTVPAPYVPGIGMTQWREGTVPTEGRSQPSDVMALAARWPSRLSSFTPKGIRGIKTSECCLSHITNVFFPQILFSSQQGNEVSNANHKL